MLWCNGYFEEKIEANNLIISIMYRIISIIIKIKLAIEERSKSTDIYIIHTESC